MCQFASSWFKGSHSTWLEYSVEKDAAYCLCCYLFKNEFVYEPTGDFYASKGFRGWNKALERFRLHVDKVNSVLHKCYNKMLDLSNRRQSIQVVLDKHSEKSKSEYRMRLEALINVARLLLYYGLPFRGHDESESSSNQGYFLGFLRWHGDNHPDVGKVILEKAPQNDTLTCHMIQKDIVNACTKETLKVIIARSVTKMERVLQAPDTAKVTVADSVPGSDERVIIISSSSRKLSGRTNCNHCNESQVTREENEGMEPHYIVLPKMLSKDNLVGCISGRKGDVIQRLRSETWDSIRGLPDWRTLHYMSYAHKLMLVKITLWHLSSIHPNPIRSAHLSPLLYARVVSQILHFQLLINTLWNSTAPLAFTSALPFPIVLLTKQGKFLCPSFSPYAIHSLPAPTKYSTCGILFRDLALLLDGAAKFSKVLTISYYCARDKVATKIIMLKILALLYYGLSWIPGRTRGSYSLATSIRSDSGEHTRILEVRLPETAEMRACFSPRLCGQVARVQLGRAPICRRQVTDDLPNREETPFTALAPPVFKGEGYHIWATRMEAYMEANDLWEAVEEEYEIPPCLKIQPWSR
ncbi:hypothetical protein FXO38_02741 [Capsicum annuum]|nr:hypothetical protein FXO38_02741 [Capsicum annuum]